MTVSYWGCFVQCCTLIRWRSDKLLLKLTLARDIVFSTMSAGLNTVAGTLYEDFEQFVLKGKRQSEAQQSFAMKVIVLVLGVVFILLVLVVEKLGALFQVGFMSCWPTF